MDSVATPVNNRDVSSNVDSNEGSEKVSVDSIDIDNEVSTDVESIDDIIRKVTNKPKVNSKRQIAVYIDEDVAKAFDRYARREGKGAKSKLIEELLRPTLAKMGYMK